MEDSNDTQLTRRKLKVASKKQIAARKRFGAATKKAKKMGLKPFTKKFGAFVKKELKKK